MWFLMELSLEKQETSLKIVFVIVVIPYHTIHWDSSTMNMCSIQNFGTYTPAHCFISGRALHSYGSFGKTCRASVPIFSVKLKKHSFITS